MSSSKKTNTFKVKQTTTTAKESQQLFTPASFPSLTAQTSKKLVSSSDKSYLNKVTKMVISENENNVLPAGFVQIKFNTKTNKIDYTYSSSLLAAAATTTTKKDDNDSTNVYAVFNALNELYIKRKTKYINLWGIDTYKSVFGNYAFLEKNYYHDSEEEI
jgi:hypothetical protein